MMIIVKAENIGGAHSQEARVDQSKFTKCTEGAYKAPQARTTVFEDSERSELSQKS